MISGGDGADRLYGGAGNDTFIIRNGDGQDRIYDFADGDELWFDGAEFSVDALRFSQTGNDTLVSFAGIDGLSIRLSGIDANELAGPASSAGDEIVITVDTAV